MRFHFDVLPQQCGDAVSALSQLTGTLGNLLFGIQPCGSTERYLSFMKALIKNILNLECEKHIHRHFQYLEQLNDHIERKTRREGRLATKTIHRPFWWAVAAPFNPFKVRAAKKLKAYSYSLAEKLRTRKYQPRPALIRYIAKEDGSRRKLNVFQLPDAAISTLTYKSLLHKNLARLSGYAYAYREDRTPHDAVNEIYSEWKGLDRVYVAEYDFSKFFDEISHAYLWSVLDKHEFIISPSERHVIQEFLNSTAAESADYPNNGRRRDRGIPQGTSISLFLANIACWELDRRLERLGVGFARYADDTLIWCTRYEGVTSAYDAIDECASRMGVELNRDKSAGISLLSRVGVPEMNVKNGIDYLGYRVALDRISISPKKVRKIKGRISFLIYQNLIQPLTQKKIFNSGRLTFMVDLDYLTAVRQVRYYLYGGLSEDKLSQYVDGRISDLNFRGVMSYYPIVNDIEQLAKLDGWLAYTFRQALRLRARLWQKNDGTELPGPSDDWIENVADMQFIPLTGTEDVDVRLPSFRRINRALSFAVSQKGIKAVANTKIKYY
jgi:RNA-directed DNA polymerase